MNNHPYQDTMTDVLFLVFEYRSLFYRERAQRYYGSTSFGLGKFLSDIPIILMESFISFIIFYFIVGFRYVHPLIIRRSLLIIINMWSVIMSRDSSICIIFLMIGYRADAGRFFFFYLVLFGLFITTSQFVSIFITNFIM